tara:strand:+ start:706 stop:1029 length:324 start_codon:yes stop_codon:yes gene_type:complete
MSDTPMKLTNASGEWEYVPLSEEEIAAREAMWQHSLTDFSSVRMIRDTELAACDWTQLADADLTEEKLAEWNTYRQALRDYPSSSTETNDDGDPLTSGLGEFPTPPE